jgi:hypothetical protein
VLLALTVPFRALLFPRFAPPCPPPLHCADLSTPDGPLPGPRTRLVAYTRQHADPGECVPLSWTLNPVAWVAAAEADGALWTQSGRVSISVGSGQPVFATSPAAVLSATAFLGPPQLLGACGDTLELQKQFYGGL